MTRRLCSLALGKQFKKQENTRIVLKMTPCTVIERSVDP